MSDSRIFSEEMCRDLFDRVRALATGGGETRVVIHSWWHGELRWARNRVTLASDRREVELGINRRFDHGRWRGVTTNQIDDASLEAAVRAAERIASREAAPGQSPLGLEPTKAFYTMPESAPIWSSNTSELSTEARGNIAREMIGPAEADGLYSAGYIEVRAASRMAISSDELEAPAGSYPIGQWPYTRWTQAQCSTVTRDLSGTSSGWAGESSYDWNRLDAQAIAERAIEKCLASRNPVALEPGRYTLILEPQAVADLLDPLVKSLSRYGPEKGNPGPWTLTYDDALNLWRSKLGLRVIDERISIGHDPMDPRIGISLDPTDPPEPVTWIDRGVLTGLGYGAETAIRSLKGQRHRLRGATGYQMSGGETTVEEMIRTTRRGLLVTRFSNMAHQPLDPTSLLTTGLTRDGLWLIENGVITKAVKNFRFTESPLFMLNNIEQIGEAVPVFRPSKAEGAHLTPAVVPSIKVRDFSFTSLIDAV